MGPPMPDLSDAQCTQTDPEIWFPASTSDHLISSVAKVICAGCPVQMDCLEYSLHWDVAGTWGGVARHERDALRSRLGLTAHAVMATPFLPPLKVPLLDVDVDEFADEWVA